VWGWGTAYGRPATGGPQQAKPEGKKS
jgi:hypothetical protein